MRVAGAPETPWIHSVGHVRAGRDNAEVESLLSLDSQPANTRIPKRVESGRAESVALKDVKSVWVVVYKNHDWDMAIVPMEHIEKRTSRVVRVPLGLLSGVSTSGRPCHQLLGCQPSLRARARKMPGSKSWTSTGNGRRPVRCKPLYRNKAIHLELHLHPSPRPTPT